MKAVFLDRDGTVNVGAPTHSRVDSLEKVELLPNTLEALKSLAELGYSVFFVTNQAGIAEGLINQKEFDEINSKILKLIHPSGIEIQKTYVCPHSEDNMCTCRKPKPGLLKQAQAEYDIDLRSSWMIGDRTSDILTGVGAGTKTILVKTGVPSVESSEATATVPSLLEAIQYILSSDALQ